MEASKQPNICPFSCRKLPVKDLFRIGTFWPGCGHRFILDDEFLRIITSSSRQNTKDLLEACPICDVPIQNIADGAALLALNHEGKYVYPVDDSFSDMQSTVNVQIVSFRQRKIHYRVGFRVLDGRAQSRIAYVLGTEESLVRILYKGKALDLTSSSAKGSSSFSASVLTSDTIVQLSKPLSKKPQLLVMSTRVEQLRDGHPISYGPNAGIINTVSKYCKLSITFIKHVTLNVLLGATWFVKSLLSKPIDSRED